MEFRPIQPAEHESARQLLATNGWAERVADPERFARMIAGSRCAIVAVEDGRVVGFARAIGDGVSNGYISTVVVDEAHRRRGVGRSLIRRLMGDDPTITWVLRAGRQSTGF
jgi:ribosomal protein S18 acetylase RimI-like enzyme